MSRRAILSLISGKLEPVQCDIGEFLSVREIPTLKIAVEMIRPLNGKFSVFKGNFENLG